MKLTITGIENLSKFELSACVSAFNGATKEKIPRGGKKLFKAGLDFPHCCDVLVKRTSDCGNYITEVK
jgi:hypothetical protein